MRIGIFGASALLALVTISDGAFACEGSLGRGWGSGKGDGKFTMAGKDKVCQIGFPNFIDDRAKTSIPATELKLTRAPKNGSIGFSAKGPVYTPAAGFKGDDKFCMRNTSAQVKGKTLSGCVTVTVR